MTQQILGGDYLPGNVLDGGQTAVTKKTVTVPSVLETVVYIQFLRVLSNLWLRLRLVHV